MKCCVRKSKRTSALASLLLHFIAVIDSTLGCERWPVDSRPPPGIARSADPSRRPTSRVFAGRFIRRDAGPVDRVDRRPESCLINHKADSSILHKHRHLLASYRPNRAPSTVSLKCFHLMAACPPTPLWWWKR